MSPKVKPQRRRKGDPPERKREVYAVAAGALVAGVVVVAVVLWDRLFPVPPESLVEVAWTHECPCAADWIETLRASGFTVRDFEIDDLSTSRQRWRLPEDSRGCHPATYLGYFIDGDVPPDKLRRLARERPRATGLVQQAAPDDHSSQDRRPREIAPILLVGIDSSRRPW